MNSSISKLEKERTEQTKKIQKLMRNQIGSATAIAKSSSKSKTRNKSGQAFPQRKSISPGSLKLNQGRYVSPYSLKSLKATAASGATGTGFSTAKKNKSPSMSGGNTNDALNIQN